MNFSELEKCKDPKMMANIKKVGKKFRLRIELFVDKEELNKLGFDEPEVFYEIKDRGPTLENMIKVVAEKTHEGINELRKYLKILEEEVIKHKKDLLLIKSIPGVKKEFERQSKDKGVIH